MSYVRLAIATSSASAALAAGLSAVGACVYLFPSEALYRLVPGSPASRPLDLFSGLLLAIAVLARTAWRPRLGAVAASAAAAILSLLRLLAGGQQLQWLTAILPYREVIGSDIHQGLGPATSTGTAPMFLLIAISVILYWARRPQLSQLAAVGSLALPTISVTGYAYGLPNFYAEMPPLTTLAGALLGVAALAMAPHRAIIRVFLSPYASGRIVRTLFALGLAVPFVTGLALARFGEAAQAGRMLGLFSVAMGWFFNLMVGISSIAHERIDQQRRATERALMRSANRDPLTGVVNRRNFDLRFGAELQRARRGRRPISLIMVDIDHFKRVNDTGGHQVGDMVLKTVAQLLGISRRLNDIVARYGGEEFVLVLPDTSAAGALQVAESLRRTIEATRFGTWPGGNGQVTASFGCATWDGTEEGEEMLRRADAALYAAKSAGRNRVVSANAEQHMPA